MTTHTTHADIIKRLKRARGQLTTVIAMIEQERPCAGVAQQMLAVEKAISQAKKTFIHDHIDHCLERSAAASRRGSRAVIEEFKGISKYL